MVQEHDMPHTAAKKSTAHDRENDRENSFSKPETFTMYFVLDTVHSVPYTYIIMYS